MSQEVKTAIRQLNNVCGLHVHDFYHGDVASQRSDFVLHVNLLSHLSCFHGLCYLTIDLTPPQYQHDKPAFLTMYRNSRSTLPGIGELLQSFPYLQYLSITAYNVRLPEDPLVYSQLLRLQLKTFTILMPASNFSMLSPHLKI